MIGHKSSSVVLSPSSFLVVGLSLLAVTTTVEPACADTISVLANADASVLLSGPTGSRTANNSETNFGTEQILRVNYNTTAASANAKAYVRFDLSSLDPSTISSASLNLFTATAGYSADNVFNIYGLRDGYSGVDNTGNGLTTDDPDIHGQNWPEDVIDWNSAPANLLSSASGTLDPADRNKFTGDAVLLGQLTIAADAPLSTPVSFSSAGLQSFLQSDTDRLVTLMIANNRETQFSFLAREAIDNNGNSGYGPQLLLQAQPVPEPSTYAMMIVGLLGFGWWQRKRGSAGTAV